MKYNIALRDRTLKRNATKIDPIVVEEIESDDKSIVEIEDPVLPTDPNWIEENVEDLVFDDEAVRNVPSGTYESSILDREPRRRELSPRPREPTPPPREPTPLPPSHEPTPPPPPRESIHSLDEPILSYKSKKKASSERPSSSKLIKISLFN